MSSVIKSGLAALKVMESWGVNRLYGFPGGSCNSILNSLQEKQHCFGFIQTRHEESAALAAAAEARLGGRPAACFASDGPGAVRLLSGLMEAQADDAPVLALICLAESGRLDDDGGRETASGLFGAAGIHSRLAARPESLPRAVDEALRLAMKEGGAAVVRLPDDCGFADIEDRDYSTAASCRRGWPVPDEPDLEAAVRLIDASRRPILYVGRGAGEAGLEVLSLADYFSLPIVSSIAAKGLVADDEENYLGTAARLGTKPANEALAAADLIIFAGSDFPGASQFFSPQAKCVQIDVDPAKLGRRHRADAAILGDAGEAMRHMIRIGRRKRRTKFLEASRLNMKNWRAWLKSFEDRGDAPLRAEPVFREINRVAAGDAIFVADVGTCLIHAARLLNMNGQGQRFTASAGFGAAGYGVPGGIAAKLGHPERQVFTLSGDGAFAMTMRDIATQVKYRLPIINVVFSNRALGLSEAERWGRPEPGFGLELPEIDFAKAAEAMGALGLTVDAPEALPQVFDAASASERPVVIDVKTENKRPFPSEAMILNEARYSREALDSFRARYEVRDMPSLEHILNSLPE